MEQIKMHSAGGSPDPRVRFRARKVLLAGLLVVLAASAAIAQTSPWESVPLAGNHPAEAATRIPVGHADGAAQLNLEVTLALRNRTGLDQLLRDQQDPASPRYHQWLTPAQFTARFGPSRQDLDAVAQWLGTEGFHVTATSLDGRYVRFTGTVSNAERVFGTHIMTFGDGSAYSNITDPAIPARFAGVIGAVVGLSNFMHSMAFAHRANGTPMEVAPASSAQFALLDSGPAIPRPAHSALSAVPNVINNGVLAFGPSDLRSFYNENPLLAGGITGGGGDCLAIVGDSDYTHAAVALFNTTFGLPASSITTVLADGTNPGINPDEDEALLDLEWSHAVAPGAPTRYYLGNGNAAITDAIAAAINDDACGTISVSFSLCGADPLFFTEVMSPLYAKAAVQGQSIFIASGDFGAAGVVLDATMTMCVTGNSRNVNELGADPNVTTVGGTFFSPDFVAGNNVGHVAESAWNQFNGATQLGTGGGVSAIYPKPAYQKGTGVPAGGKRDVPDIALISALSSDGGGVFLGVGPQDGGPAIGCCFIGTSLSAPAWAGISKLIAQLEKKRPGPLNPRIYQLANAGLAASGFRDVLTGNNDNNGVVGFNAGVGFDLTTGWGTVDISTFANSFAATTAPLITSVTSIIQVGASFNITGARFSAKPEVNFFVATASGPKNKGPLFPSSISATSLTVPVPATVPLGQGFVSVQVVNTDQGSKSNSFPALLQGSAAAGIPSLTGINGVPLDATSRDPSFATNNVKTVVIQGSTVKLEGAGFDATHGVAVDVFCACPVGGKVGPFHVSPGATLSATSLSFPLPKTGPEAPPTGPGSFVVINKGADGHFSKSSNAVSAPIGHAITVTKVTQVGGTITVDGTGFSTLTAINFFNTQAGVVKNLGGLIAGKAIIPLTIVNDTRFTFTKPASAVAGSSYVQALNPPFVPFTSSGSDPGGAFNLK